MKDSALIAILDTASLSEWSEIDPYSTAIRLRGMAKRKDKTGFKTYKGYCYNCKVYLHIKGLNGNDLRCPKDKDHTVSRQ